MVNEERLLEFLEEPRFPKEVEGRFGGAERTIRYWMKDLEGRGLIVEVPYFPDLRKKKWGSVGDWRTIYEFEQLQRRH